MKRRRSVSVQSGAALTRPTVPMTSTSTTTSTSSWTTFAFCIDFRGMILTLLAVALALQSFYLVSLLKAPQAHLQRTLLPPQPMQLHTPLVFPLPPARTATPELHADALTPRSFEFAMVTDLDEKSRDPFDFVWRAVLKKGRLHRRQNGNYTVEFSSEFNLTSQTARRNRSMELSELVLWRSGKSHHPLLLAMCDYSGIVYKISPEGKVFRRYTIADGDGNEPNPCKMEWATIKDDHLFIGSVGKEFVDDYGNLINYNAEWVKMMDSRGFIDNLNWQREYHKLRESVNATFPGYLMHEAVTWNPYSRTWVFLPRKHSTHAPYTVKGDERQGTNLLLIADENISTVRVERVGEVELEWGFSSIKLVPGTSDHYMALKVREIGLECRTKLTVFDGRGHFLMDPPWAYIGDEKYEGLEFLSTSDSVS